MTGPHDTAVALAEIESSRGGASTGAFFDMDGTLIHGHSATHLSSDRLKRRELQLEEVFDTLRAGLNMSLGQAEFDALLEVAARSWAGRKHEDLLKMGERLFSRKLVNLIFPEMRSIVRAHQARGHTVVLCSSATCYQVEPVARHLGIEHILCNRFALNGQGELTGRIDPPVLWGEGKARVVQRFAQERNIDLHDSYFYADGDEELGLMHLVGKPRPTNPGKRLESVARRRGWPVQKFYSRKENSQLRTMAGVASVVPAGMVGLGVGLLKQDKRAGLNVGIPMWLKAFLRINGVELNVVGKDNLWRQRPAVFIFNHRNGYDPWMAAAMLERDFSVVAKKGIESNWLMGPIGKLTNMAFIDRDNPRAAVEALKPMEDMLRQGISALIAPEGTRYDTQQVGPFKKGPFRMAMSAQVPVVPIVFRNAEMVAARDAATLCPGTVDVAVLPPIDVCNWQANELKDRIESVRQLYLDTLANWPGRDDGS